jgi:apolipoprotein N-acyltransferase
MGVLDTTLQGQQGLTPYVRIGNGLILGISVLILFAAWWRRKSKSTNDTPNDDRSA